MGQQQKMESEETNDIADCVNFGITNTENNITSNEVFWFCLYLFFYNHFTPTAFVVVNCFFLIYTEVRSTSI